MVVGVIFLHCTEPAILTLKHRHNDCIRVLRTRTNKSFICRRPAGVGELVVHLTTDHEIEVSNPTTAWAEDNLRIKQVLLPMGLNEADMKSSSILIDSVTKQSIHTQRKYKKRVVVQNKLNLFLENHFYNTLQLKAVYLV
jgi:hypothetical protein